MTALINATDFYDTASEGILGLLFFSFCLFFGTPELKGVKALFVIVIGFGMFGAAMVKIKSMVLSPKGDFYFGHLENILTDGIKIFDVNHAREFLDRVSADKDAVKALFVFDLEPANWSFDEVVFRKRMIENLLKHGYAPARHPRKYEKLEWAFQKLEALKREAPSQC